MKNETLVLLTNNYPYGNGESFLESEIEYLSLVFKKIIIISSSKGIVITRKVPVNVFVERFSYSITILDKLLSIKHLLNSMLLNEIKFTKSYLKLNWTFFKLKTNLVSLINSEKINKFIIIINDKYKINQLKCVYYSYWMGDYSIALSNSGLKNILCRVHGWDLYFERSIEDYLPLRKQILENLHVFSISSIGREYLQKKTGIDKVEFSRLGTKKLERNTTDPTKFRIMSCSNLIPLKRVGLIAESLASLAHIDFEWVHFGEGPLFEEVKLFAKEKNINVNFKGNTPNKEILDYLQKVPINVFLNLSTTEGIPVSIMEAYSCGIPAIATNVGGTAELVNNENGVLLKPNPLAIEVANEIEKFYSLSKDKVLNKRNNAFNTWNTKFNAEKNYTKFANIISNL